MKKLGGEKSMTEREIETFHEDLRSGDGVNYKDTKHQKCGNILLL